jgi:phospholipid/cholesterol/gamma-HCH transport system permease protein
VVAWTGKKAVGGFEYAAEVTTLGVLSLRELFRTARGGRREVAGAIVRQIAFTGIDALPFAALAGTMVGFIIIMQAALTLPQVGAGEYLAGVLILSIVYEIGPLVAAFVVLWRSGTAMCTELGNRSRARSPRSRRWASRSSAIS